MTGFDSSDDENQIYETSEFSVDWLNLTKGERCTNLALSGLPGCRFKDTWRNIGKDLDTLKRLEINAVFVLCTKGELNKYRVPKLLNLMEDVGLTVCHYPFPDGCVPPMPNLLKMIAEIKSNLKSGHKVLVHCYGGLGRSALVAACTMLSLDEIITSKEVIDYIREIRGPRAIQTVKQYNFVNEFRDKLHCMEKEDGT